MVRKFSVCWIGLLILMVICFMSSSVLAQVPETVKCVRAIEANQVSPPESPEDGTELSYDDGSAEMGWVSVCEGVDVQLEFATCFQNPCPGKVKVLTARYYIYHVGIATHSFNVHVRYQETPEVVPGEDIIPPFAVAAPGPGWYDVDLSAYNIQIDPNHCFAIGIQPLECVPEFGPFLGEDTDAPIDCKSWCYNLFGDGLWNNWCEFSSGDLMIRTVVECQEEAASIKVDQIWTEDVEGDWDVSFINNETITVNEAITIEGDPSVCYDAEIRFLFRDAAGNRTLFGRQYLTNVLPGTYYISQTNTIPATAVSGLGMVRNVAILTECGTRRPRLDTDALHGFIHIELAE